MSIEKFLTKDTSGNFRKLLIDSFSGRYQFWAQRLNDAIKSFETDEKMLLELVIMADEKDWVAIKLEYMKLFRRDVVEDIQDDMVKNAN